MAMRIHTTGRDYPASSVDRAPATGQPQTQRNNMAAAYADIAVHLVRSRHYVRITQHQVEYGPLAFLAAARPGACHCPGIDGNR